ncbi:MmcQ/YjbR family DNA-binding protein [Archangium violaceum]|uniref:MmcQ/YjbR family DNA-binding protein n=1 Tax=Archangium violaceum TaxID=83451 RepID=UPI002B311C5E|nr:MmcQ/YjbR family DNA-binding protein [Archangium violaceum]
MSMTPVPPEMKRLVPFEMALREVGIRYPEVTEDFPWGHRTLKVKGKAFVFMGVSAEGFFMSVKLPQSNGAALMLPFAQPTGYGLGKSGWVSVNFGARDTPPVELLSKWLDESYRAVAPKKLVAQLSGEAGETTAAPAKARSAPARKPATAAAKKTAAKKPAAKKPAAKKAAPQKKAAKKTVASKQLLRT